MKILSNKTRVKTERETGAETKKEEEKETTDTQTNNMTRIERQWEQLLTESRDTNE